MYICSYIFAVPTELLFALEINLVFPAVHIEYICRNVCMYVPSVCM